MELRAYPQTKYGQSDSSPVLTDVEAKLRSIASTRSFAFYFRPEIHVDLWGHIQGVARVPRAGEDHWFVFSKHDEDNAANAGLLLVDFPRVDSQGESFARTAPPGGPGEGKLEGFWGRNQSTHPGGMHLCGSLLAVAHQPDRGYAWVSIVDVQNPRNPVLITKLVFDGSHGELERKTLTAAALTRLDDGHYLLFAYRYTSSDSRAYQGWFFRTNEPFLNQNTSFKLVSSLTADDNTADAHWVSSYDNVAFLNQADGGIYLLGLRGKGTDNHVDAFLLKGQRPELEYRMTKHVRTRAGGATLRAGGCFHVTPSGELVLYAVEKAGGGRVRRLMIEELSRRAIPEH